MEFNDVRRELHELCSAFVQKRLVALNQAIAAAQASANDETKSSAGDKYETGRAMAQLEIEKNTEQLNEAMKLKRILNALVLKGPTESIQAGSLVITDQGNYYLSIPAGPLKVDQQTYFAVSVDSPIGARLLGLTAGSNFTFRDKDYHVLKIT